LKVGPYIGKREAGGNTLEQLGQNPRVRGEREQGSSEGTYAKIKNSKNDGPECGRGKEKKRTSVLIGATQEGGPKKDMK